MLRHVLKRHPDGLYVGRVLLVGRAEVVLSRLLKASSAGLAPSSGIGVERYVSRERNTSFCLRISFGRRVELAVVTATVVRVVVNVMGVFPSNVCTLRLCPQCPCSCLATTLLGSRVPSSSGNSVILNTAVRVPAVRSLLEQNVRQTC